MIVYDNSLRVVAGYGNPIPHREQPADRFNRKSGTRFYQLRTNRVGKGVGGQDRFVPGIRSARFGFDPSVSLTRICEYRGAADSNDRRTTRWRNGECMATVRVHLLPIPQRRPGDVYGQRWGAERYHNSMSMRSDYRIRGKCLFGTEIFAYTRTVDTGGVIREATEGVTRAQHGSTASSHAAGITGVRVDGFIDAGDDSEIYTVQGPGIGFHQPEEPCDCRVGRWGGRSV